MSPNQHTHYFLARLQCTQVVHGARCALRGAACNSAALSAAAFRGQSPFRQWRNFRLIFPFPKAAGLLFLPCGLGNCSLACHNLLGQHVTNISGREFQT